MKNIFIVILLLFLYSFSGSSIKKPPEKVKNELLQKYPSARSVKWENEETNKWEASFNIGGKEITVSFDNTGKWLETEIEIDAQDLPSPVSGSLKKDFREFRTDEIAILESPEIKGFEVDLKKGSTFLEVVFDANGKVLRNINVSEEDNQKKTPK